MKIKMGFFLLVILPLSLMAGEYDPPQVFVSGRYNLRSAPEPEGGGVMMVMPLFRYIDGQRERVQVEILGRDLRQPTWLKVRYLGLEGKSIEGYIHRNGLSLGGVNWSEIPFLDRNGRHMDIGDQVVTHRTGSARSGPSGRYRYLGQIFPGQVFKILEEQNGYLRLEDSDGKVRWAPRTAFELHVMDEEPDEPEHEEHPITGEKEVEEVDPQVAPAPDSKDIANLDWGQPICNCDSDRCRRTDGVGIRGTHPVTAERGVPHKGLDFGAPNGTPVAASRDGVVRRMFWDRRGGRILEVEHDDGLVTRYMHLRRYSAGLKPGQRVEQGEVLGQSGATGGVTGPHLHFEIRRITYERNGKPKPSPQWDLYNPESVMDVKSWRGVSCDSLGTWKSENQTRGGSAQ